jgi:hypothetical protein
VNPRQILSVQRDRLLAIVVAVVGALCILGGWLGASRTAYAAEQIPYILSGGLGGLVLVGIGIALWLSADLRDEWRKLDSIDQALRDLRGTPLVEDSEP